MLMDVGTYGRDSSAGGDVQRTSQVFLSYAFDRRCPSKMFLYNVPRRVYVAVILERL